MHPLAPAGRAALVRAWGQHPVGLALLAVASVLAVLVLAALGDRLLNQQKVLPGVRVASVDVGGMSERDALAALQPVADRIRTRPVSVRVGSRTLSVDPSALGLRVDVRRTVRAAREAGRDRNPLDQLAGTLLRRVRDDDLGLVVSFDRNRFAGVLDGWVAQTGSGLQDGGLRFEGTQVVEIPPKAGTGIQRSAARRQVVAALEHGRSNAGSLAIGPTTPAVDAADVARAARRARALLAAPVTLRVRGTSLPLAPEQVAPTLRTETVGSRLVLRSDPSLLRLAFGGALAPLETAPQDAGFAVNGTTASVVPAVTGSQVDLEAVAEKLADGRHVIDAPMRAIPPARTTEWATKLNITELVSSFTTYHPCCAPRVSNIQRAADVINGTIVEPGQVFSLNDALGPRTAEKGYLPAPAISADLGYEEAVGGGVSQLSTTLYNATFFGCYEDVTHTVHALYISRYPMGREATLNYPSIDNRFRNDSNSGILIRTSYTPTSITVSYYGNREGRSCRAEGPNVLEEIPPGVEYVDDPSLPAGTERVVTEGKTGYVVENFRIISRPGQPDKREHYRERYSTVPTKIARGTAAAAPPPAP